MKYFLATFVTTSALLLAACGGGGGGGSSNATNVEPPPSFTPSLTLSVALNGAQSVPVVDTQATASATIEVDQSLYQFRATLDISDIDNVQAAHIHQGRIGVNGDVAFAFEAVDDDSMAIAITDLSAELIDDMLDGDWYINVHTTTHASGEVRGQIVNPTTTVVTFMLSGSQSVPAVMTDAVGYGYATLDSNGYEVDLKVHTMAVEDATMAHIHEGFVGENGGVVVALEQHPDDINVWQTPQGAMLDEATAMRLVSGGHYVNVHTPANPSGELRGQILTDNFALLTFDLSGQQEVPAVATTAMGYGYATLNLSDYAVDLKVLTNGLDNASMAHIHEGYIGENGGVVVALEQHPDNTNVWQTPAGAMLDEATAMRLADGGHYVNVHSPDNPSGELRGQIVGEQVNLYTFPLTGEQVLGGVTTSAMGYGYATLDNITGLLRLRIMTMGLMDASAAHIHEGERGVSGGVVVGLEQSAADTAVWSIPENTLLDSATAMQLKSGGHYVNVHTPAYPGGELRGQIE
ncbi:CHRD domain-containing protein [Neiella sp. HB171785]|uniref:CHRD domain-containing protein n=1 Tax=Neiella litorisoli TaxID=2771431 RepID=A0A8J6QUM5_9GAMM|nr:CHRD domain-containing protein [Neiella litorisoli]MBD1391054.1 CHRD domain-containing protein [Neiella litorisoli]